jgi:DNA-binding NtrC family response regulator
MSETLQLIRVLIVSEQRDMCELWQRIIDMTPGMLCPAYGLDGEMAVQLVTQIRPSVVFMDMSLPKMSGEAATKLILAQYPRMVVILYSADSSMEQRALNAGAAAFVLMPVAPDKLTSIIRRIYREHRNNK